MRMLAPNPYPLDRVFDVLVSELESRHVGCVRMLSCRDASGRGSRNGASTDSC